MPTISATPSDAPVGQQKKGSASGVANIPFARSSKLHIEQGNTASGIAINVAAPGTFNFTLPSYGYLSAIFVTCEVTGGSGVAAVYSEDAPWSIIQSLMLQDVNGVPIWQLSGYHAMLASKYGGYRPFGPDQPNVAPATVGSINWNTPDTELYNTPTSGNFKFILPIYLEFGRDGLGCLPKHVGASGRKAGRITSLNSVELQNGQRRAKMAA